MLKHPGLFAFGLAVMLLGFSVPSPLTLVVSVPLLWWGTRRMSEEELAEQVRLSQRTIERVTDEMRGTDRGWRRWLPDDNLPPRSP